MIGMGRIRRLEKATREDVERERGWGGWCNPTLKISMCEKKERRQRKGEMRSTLALVIFELPKVEIGLETNTIGASYLSVTQTRIKALPPASICFVTMAFEDVSTV